MSSKAEQILAGLGGADNIVEIEACITRLRTEVKDAAQGRREGAQGRRRPRRGGVRQRRPGRGRPRGRQPRRGHRGPDVTRPAVEVLAPCPGRLVPIVRDPRPRVRRRDGRARAWPSTRTRARSTVVSPIAGKVVKVHPHAFVVLGADGVGVLVHLGINTVRLEGEGFEVLAEQGATVAAGDPMVRWDPSTITGEDISTVVPGRGHGPAQGLGARPGRRRRRGDRRRAVHRHPVRPAALLLDLDGTLVDSEPVHRAAYGAFFADRGWAVTDDLGHLHRPPGRGRLRVEPGPWAGARPARAWPPRSAAGSPDDATPEPVPGAPRRWCSSRPARASRSRS